MALENFDSIEHMVNALEPGYPVYCVHPSVLHETARQFLEKFPGEVLYAVKCNPHPEILNILYQAGIRHFDTASLAEIAQISEQFPDAHRYFMHPVKPRAAILTATDVYNVRHFVVDHYDELVKVVEQTGARDDICIMVRMATPSAGAIYELSRKFGADPSETVDLLQRVASLNVKRGIAFHVGSQCTRSNAFETALALVSQVLSLSGDIDALDVGGGFPAIYKGTFAPSTERFMEVIRDGVKRLGLPDHCQVLCEPGRAMVADGMSLVVQVQLRKGDQIYINDGIYGSLAEAATGGIRYPVRHIRPEGPSLRETMEFTVNGPTCDSVDVLPDPFLLPDDIREGDWIEVQKIGAYSNANATRFNGFFPETMVSISA